MNFIFWQNILSIHQSALIRNLAEKHDVTLVCEEGVPQERIKQGWINPDFGNANVIVNPTEEEINNLLENKNAIHIFTSIQSFKMPSYVLGLAVKKGAKIGVQSEPFDWIGIKGKLRFLKRYFLQFKYGKYIDFILAIGNKGRWSFEVTGFAKKKIYDWGYFTEMPDSHTTSFDRKKPIITFVGRIDENKNILQLIAICKKVKDSIFNLNIVGDGPLKDKMKSSLEGTNFKYWGALSNKGVLHVINDSDLLVLPSVYKDGWGAVVNEALMCGTPVISSDNCGASVLLSKERGKVFSVKNNDLESVLVSFLAELPYDGEERDKIKKWATDNISGIAASKYLENIVSHIYQNIGEKPIAPWLK
jgi:glycosyltransferase involved in cell wall biosynthesis